MSKNKQDFNAFVVTNYETDGEEKSIWTKVGVAFKHGNADGINLKITDGISVSGDIVLLPPSES